MTPDETTRYWATANQVCTPKEIEALQLREHGLGARRTALILGISRGTVRSRLERADQRITEALTKQEAA